MQVSWGIDLATEHERFLTEELFKQPVIVYDYPKEIKAFYMKLNEDGKTVAAMDVLVPKVCARGPLTNMSRKGLLRGLKAINWPCSSYAPAAVAVTMQCRCNELALQHADAVSWPCSRSYASVAIALMKLIRGLWRVFREVTSCLWASSLAALSVRTDTTR
eukprot:scaffold9245_cov22-Tisochrysis_lutea.AAC.5